MVRALALVAVLASLAVAASSELREDGVTLVQQGVLREVDVTEHTDDTNAVEESGASVVGQGVASFAAAVQAMRFQMTMGQLFEEDVAAVLGGETSEPLPSKCTPTERSRANETVMKLAGEMLSSNGNNMATVMNSVPTSCPRDAMAIAALAVSNGKLGPCMQQLLGVSESCSGCMVSFLSQARGCMSQCIPMLMGCGNPSAWSDNSDKAKCPEKSSTCLACNVPHLKAMTECSGAFPEHRDEFFKFLGGAVNLVKDGNTMDTEKVKDYVVQFVKKMKEGN